MGSVRRISWFVSLESLIEERCGNFAEVQAEAVRRAALEAGQHDDGPVSTQPTNPAPAAL